MGRQLSLLRVSLDLNYYDCVVVWLWLITNYLDLFKTGDNKTIPNSYSSAEIVTYQNERYNCIGYGSLANASSIIIDVLINEAGLHRIGALDAEEPLILKAMQKRSLFYLDQGIGWLYFVLWSVSFYPQVIAHASIFDVKSYIRNSLKGHYELSSPIRRRF